MSLISIYVVSVGFVLISSLHLSFSHSKTIKAKIQKFPHLFTANWIMKSIMVLFFILLSYCILHTICTCLCYAFQMICVYFQHPKINTYLHRNIIWCCTILNLLAFTICYAPLINKFINRCYFDERLCGWSILGFECSSLKANILFFMLCMAVCALFSQEEVVCWYEKRRTENKKSNCWWLGLSIQFSLDCLWNGWWFLRELVTVIICFPIFINAKLKCVYVNRNIYILNNINALKSKWK